MKRLFQLIWTESAKITPCGFAWLHLWMYVRNSVFAFNFFPNCAYKSKSLQTLLSALSYHSNVLFKLLQLWYLFVLCYESVSKTIGFSSTSLANKYKLQLICWIKAKVEEHSVGPLLSSRPLSSVYLDSRWWMGWRRPVSDIFPYYDEHSLNFALHSRGQTTWSCHFPFIL